MIKEVKVKGSSDKKTVGCDEETDLNDDGDEFKAGIDLINFGMPRQEEIAADIQTVYKKAKKLTSYVEEEKGGDTKSSN